MRWAHVLACASLSVAWAGSPDGRLAVGIAQLTPEPSLEANRDKIVRYIAMAKSRGLRLTVFPEGALAGDSGDNPSKVQAALEQIRLAARNARLYVVLGGRTASKAGEKPSNWMKVFEPSGREIFHYDKIYDRHTAKMPGVFFVDGIPCGGIICADRWLRGIEELPIMLGARVSFELSNNFESEWVPELGWYWYVPRAQRNNVFVVFANACGPGKHGHSAVIDPDGVVVSAARENTEQLVAATIDAGKASRAEALRRLEHPVFRSFWETGLKLMPGEAGGGDLPAQFPSPQVELKIAAAQMACSRVVEENVGKMEKLIRKAGLEGADAVVFPELAVTGALDADIVRSDAPILRGALTRLREAARAAKVCAVFGMPFADKGARRNSAFAIGPDGAELTRYDQLVTDRPRLFQNGSQTGRMWFEVKGVPAVVTIGKEALWSEIAEMAALAGAELHFHLSYGHDAGAEAALRRLQIWNNLASFHTFTATVNAASPRGMPSPSAPASGGSALWDDLDGAAETRLAVREQKKKPGHELLPIYSSFSANCVAVAGQEERLLYASCKPNRNNAHRCARYNPAMAAWYALGAKLAAGGRDPYRPLPEK